MQGREELESRTTSIVPSEVRAFSCLATLRFLYGCNWDNRFGRSVGRQTSQCFLVRRALVFLYTARVSHAFPECPARCSVGDPQSWGVSRRTPRKRISICLRQRRCVRQRTRNLLVYLLVVAMLLKQMLSGSLVLRPNTAAQEVLLYSVNLAKSV